MMNWIEKKTIPIQFSYKQRKLEEIIFIMALGLS
jgi:hypothetical protein